MTLRIIPRRHAGGYRPEHPDQRGLRAGAGQPGAAGGAGSTAAPGFGVPASHDAAHTGNSLASCFYLLIPILPNTVKC